MCFILKTTKIRKHYNYTEKLKLNIIKCWKSHTHTGRHSRKSEPLLFKVEQLSIRNRESNIYGIQIKTKAKRELIMKLKSKLKLKPSNNTHHSSNELWLWLRFQRFPLQILGTCVEQIIVSESQYTMYTNIPITVDPIITDGSHLVKKEKNTTHII